MTATYSSYANAPWMRVVALVLAVLLAILCWFVWQNAERWRAPGSPAAAQLPDIGTSDAVTACIRKRTDEIDRLLDQGLMDADAVELSIERARSLCVQRN